MEGQQSTWIPLSLAKTEDAKRRIESIERHARACEERADFVKALAISDGTWSRDTEQWSEASQLYREAKMIAIEAARIKASLQEMS